MTDSDQPPAWLIYQRCVAAFAMDRYSQIDVVIQPNVILKGYYSGVNRQVDVLVDARWNTDSSRRILIDAKIRKGKIDINDVEAIIGMMQDIRADQAVIVTTSGFSSSALRRAQDAVNMLILPFEKALEYQWIYGPCLGECATNAPDRKKGMVLWGETLLHGTQIGLWLTLQTGKCDVCHSFHVWCWDCGERFAVPDQTIVTCSCGLQWGSIPESHESGHVGESTSIWLLMRENNDPANLPVPFDRKPLK